MLTQTQRTRLTPIGTLHKVRYWTLQRLGDRSQHSLEEVHGKHHHGTFKKEKKLGPQHYPIHQWKLAGKEKKGREEGNC